MLALDRHYLAVHGKGLCPTCNKPLDGDGPPLLLSAITDYLLLSEGKAGYTATNGRLSHVVAYVAETGPTVTVAAIDEAWADKFRAWLHKQPVRSVKGKLLRDRSLGHVEGCVRQLVAAINATPGFRAPFTAEQPRSVSKSPTYRADAKTLAAMFRFALAGPERVNLLRYLRIAVATWARPDAIFDLKGSQWLAEAGVLDLNPAGRRQTKKHRPKVPVAKQMHPWLAIKGNYMPVSTIRSTWEKMRAELGLPEGGEAGLKLIRRSVSTIARRKIGEANWIQGEMMLGHVKAKVSDIYALPDPANLGLALAATEEIIAEIECLVPGAYRSFTANVPSISVVNGGKNG